jgi:hypothetical protein
MSEDLNLADKSIMYHWLIDRVATGFDFNILKEMYLSEFGVVLDFEAYSKFVTDNADKIDDRHKELRNMVYNSGIYFKMDSIINNIYKKISDANSDLSAKELSSLATTLHKYLDTFSNYGRAKQEVKQVTTNNYLIIESLEKSGLIKIIDPNKLKKEIDGEIIDVEPNENL